MPKQFLAHKVLAEKNTNLYNISKDWDRSVGKEEKLIWFQYILFYEQSNTLKKSLEDLIFSLH